jgi:osmotically inducible protein OsmC
MGRSMRKPTPLSIALSARERGADGDLYVTTVSVAGGAEAHGRASGLVRSADGELALELRMPPDLGGGGGGTNPEQLFGAAYAACFHGALVLLAERHGFGVQASRVGVTVTLRRDPVDGLFALAAEVRVAMPDVPKDAAEQLVRNAERVCPYAKMARQGIACAVLLVDAL